MNHGHLDFPCGPQKPRRQPSTVGSVRESEARAERRKVWEILLHLHSRLQVHKELQKAGYRRKKTHSKLLTD